MAAMPTFALPVLPESAKKNSRTSLVNFDTLTQLATFGSIVLASDRQSDFTEDGGEPSVGFLHGFKVNHDASRTYDVYLPHLGTTLPFKYIAVVFHTDAPMIVGKMSNSEVYSGNLVGLKRLPDDSLICHVQCIETGYTKEIPINNVVFTKDLKFGLTGGGINEAKEV